MSPNTFLKSVGITTILWFSIATVSAQVTQKIGGNPFSIDSKAVLELESTTKGFLLPRMTEVQMNSITIPTEAMMVYCTDCGVGSDGELRIAYNSIWQTFKGNLTGNITGNAATVTTNANLTGAITSVGNVTIMAASPSLTGIPTAPTATAGTNTTQLATTAFVAAATSFSNFVDLTTAQTVAGSKTFSSDLNINGVTVGLGSGSINTNTAMGKQTLQANTTGFLNTALGTYSLYTNTVGSRNSAIGVNSLYNNNAYDNTAVGYLSLQNNTSGSFNTGTGSEVLSRNTTGMYNSAVGTYALKVNTGANSNSAFGYSTLSNNTTGSGNTATGSSSLISNTTGTYNVGYGSQSLESSTTADQNTAIGTAAIDKNTTGGRNAVLGAFAGRFISNGTTNNTIINNSVLLGAETKPNADNETNQIVIGYRAIGNGSNTVQLGNASITNVKTSGTLTADAVTYPKAHGTSGQVLATTGSGALTWTTPSTTATAYTGILPLANGGTGSSTQNFVDLTTSQTVDGVKTFSVDAIVNGISVGRGLGSVSSNTAVGNLSLKSNTTGYVNSAYGFNALMSATTGSNNTAIGGQSLYKNTTGSNNTAIGAKAISENTIGSGNIALGFETFYTNISGNNNAAVGTTALHENTTGSSNSAYGNSAMYKNTTGANNIAIGSESLFEGTMNLNNTAIGTQALKNQNASRNTALGYQAGLSITTADNNTVIGASADVTGVGTTNATALGYGAVVTANNTIQLGNSSVVNVKTSGTITADAVTYPKAHGTSGQVLATAGSGALTWTTPSTTATAYSGTLPLVNGGTGSSTQNFVDLTTSQTVGGVKTFNSDIVINGLTVGKGGSNLNYNTAVGKSALAANLAGGQYNTALGESSLVINSTGSYNTALGFGSGSTLTTGSENTLIGVNSATSANGINAIAIGFGAVASSNTVQLGNISITNVKTSGTITADAVTYPKAHGVSGQVLATTGSGTLVWVTAFVREVANEFTATASQTSFTLTQAPSSNSKVKMYVNGVRISNTAYSVSGSTLTYIPANNGTYNLLVSDRIQFDYYY